jgi:hypothetical protein
MFRRLINKKFVFLAACCAAVAAVAIPATTRTTHADDNAGQMLLATARAVHGGAEFQGLQFLTAKSAGFVNVAPIAGAGLGTGGAAASVEVKLNLTDYQDKDGRRRLDVSATAPSMAAMGPTFLVYTGNSGGGMYMGNEFRVSDATASRHWGLMGFGTLNRAVDGQLEAAKQPDQANSYVVEVRYNPDDTVRYWIDKRTFFITKVVTRYKSKVIVEEERSDYRKVSCMWLPFRVVTRLGGQRLADLTIDSYDLQTEVPSARFTIAVVP